MKIGPGSVKIGDRTHTGPVLVVAAYPNPLNDKKYVVIIASNDFNSFVLTDTDFALKGDYDVAVWQIVAGRGQRLAGKFWWDNSWQRLEVVNMK